jgi:hypothetical protein
MLSFYVLDVMLSNTIVLRDPSYPTIYTDNTTS